MIAVTPGLRFGSLSYGDACVDVLAECKKRHAPVGGGGLEGRVGFEPTTPGLKVGFPFVPHPALLAESEGKVGARSARTNPPVLPG